VGDVVVVNYGFSISLKKERWGTWVLVQRREKARGFTTTHLFVSLSFSHHLIINLVEKQHKKRRITKREGDKANEVKEAMLKRRIEAEKTRKEEKKM